MKRVCRFLQVTLSCLKRIHYSVPYRASIAVNSIAASPRKQRKCALKHITTLKPLYLRLLFLQMQLCLLVGQAPGRINDHHRNVEAIDKVQESNLS